MQAICRRIAGGKAAGKELYSAATRVRSGGAPYQNEELLFIATGVLEPFITSRKLMTSEKNRQQGIMKELAAELPGYDLVQEIEGFGEVSLCAITGEAGPLSNYRRVGNLWSMFGLSPHSHQNPYSRARRAIMFNVGDALIKKQNRFRDLRDERMTYEIEKARAAGLDVVDRAVPHDERQFRMGMGHIRARANRYMQKELLKELWRAWH